MAKYLIIDKDEQEVTFVAKVKKNNISLKYSKNSIWSENVRNKDAGSLVDNGNGVEIHLNGHILAVDYSDFEKLHILCNLKVKTDKNL